MVGRSAGACARKCLAGRRLSIRTHSFLAKLVVPRDAPLLVAFYMGDGLLRPLTVAGETYRVVGDDYGTKIGLAPGGCLVRRPG